MTSIDAHEFMNLLLNQIGEELDKERREKEGPDQQRKGSRQGTLSEAVHTNGEASIFLWL